MTGGGEDQFRSGRFRAGLDPVIRSYTRSLEFDRRLVRHDLVASLAHARMLMERGIVSREHAATILEGLGEILRDVEGGRLQVDGPDEDVHGWIERTLHERVGEAAGHVHTGRSRNDQTSAALRLFVREELRRLGAAVADLVEVWLEDAGRHRETLMPGYTHLQRGQPVTLSHHLLAHAWAFLEDAGRLRRAHDVAGTSPLGAGALAGTSHPVDPHRTAELLGLERVFRNSIHAVSDRGYVAETAFACALIMVDLSRWAEEVVLWTSTEFGFATLADGVAHGSSIMPQKKNPETAELIRGKCGRAVGDLTAILTMLKGLPLAYDSDMQEDKEPLFDTLGTTRESLWAASALAGGLSYRTKRLREAVSGAFVTATELADHLVRRGIPFREAHRQAGRAVRAAEVAGCELWELSASALGECCPDAGPEARGALDPDRALRAHDSPGGPAPDRAAEQLEEARNETAELRRWALDSGKPTIYSAYSQGRLMAEELR